MTATGKNTLNKQDKMMVKLIIHNKNDKKFSVLSLLFFSFHSCNHPDLSRYSYPVHLCILAHLSPGQNGRHFADNIFRCIFMNEKFCILIKISLNFVPMGDNNPALG